MALPNPTSGSPPQICFDVNGVMAMIPGDSLAESALVWQLFQAVVRRTLKNDSVQALNQSQPCPSGVSLPTPSNPGMCVDAEGTMLPIISSNMTAAAQAVKAIGYTTSTLSVVVSRCIYEIRKNIITFYHSDVPFRCIFTDHVNIDNLLQ